MSKICPRCRRSVFDRWKHCPDCGCEILDAPGSTAPLPVLSPGGPAEVDEVGAISNGKLSVPRGRESRLTMSFAGLVMVAVGLVAMFAIGRSLFHTSDFSEQRFNFLISSTAGVVLLLVGGFVLLIRPGNQGTTSTVATIIGTTVSAIAGVLLTALIVVVFVCAGIYAMFVNMFQTCFG